jgi:hypothetical protein
MPFDATDPETKAALSAAVAEAVTAAKAAAEESTAALADNNKKLVAQLREAKKGAEIDPTKHAALEDRVGELEGQLTAAETASKKALKDATAQVENLNKQLQSESGFTQKLLVDNGLSDALVKAGVDTAFLPAVKAMLASQVSVVAEGDTRKAVAGDKSLSDFVASWASGDEGKHFVKAPANSGGGAQGGAGAGGVKTIVAGDKKAFSANLDEIAKGNSSSVRIV